MKPFLALRFAFAFALIIGLGISLPTEAQPPPVQKEAFEERGGGQTIFEILAAEIALGK